MTWLGFQLRALRYPHGPVDVDAGNPEAARKLVIWLENLKIREYKIEDRKPLADTASPTWRNRRGRTRGIGSPPPSPLPPAASPSPSPSAGPTPSPRVGRKRSPPPTPSPPPSPPPSPAASSSPPPPVGGPSPSPSPGPGPSPSPSPGPSPTRNRRRSPPPSPPPAPPGTPASPPPQAPRRPSLRPSPDIVDNRVCARTPGICGPGATCTNVGRTGYECSCTRAPYTTFDETLPGCVDASGCRWGTARPSPSAACAPVNECTTQAQACGGGATCIDLPPATTFPFRSYDCSCAAFKDYPLYDWGRGACADYDGCLAGTRYSTVTERCVPFDACAEAGDTLCPWPSSCSNSGYYACRCPGTAGIPYAFDLTSRTCKTAEGCPYGQQWVNGACRVNPCVPNPCGYRSTCYPSEDLSTYSCECPTWNFARPDWGGCLLVTATSQSIDAGSGNGRAALMIDGDPSTPRAVPGVTVDFGCWQAAREAANRGMELCGLEYRVSVANALSGIPREARLCGAFNRTNPLPAEPVTLPCRDPDTGEPLQGNYVILHRSPSFSRAAAATACTAGMTSDQRFLMQQLFLCEMTPCMDGRTLKQVAGRWQCVVDVCPAGGCGNGVCQTRDDGSPGCRCLAGWTGDRCDRQCPDGTLWEDGQCVKDTCRTVNCGQGVCQLTPSGPTCACSANWQSSVPGGICDTPCSGSEVWQRGQCVRTRARRTSQGSCSSFEECRITCDPAVGVCAVPAAPQQPVCVCRPDAPPGSACER
ncbi:hypothetical protein HYH03_012645 [Edaphochlamys debaryana]|uniref:EGF-like domain-containing protein n=1 Tax=Edaphochlamys debaryana TaxID=47281 RepID=A0A835XSB9_9CHLO|nr:hypothetical protein HYH03_012645 [Edaphochlamys debaryana]|eukprot:KAG2488849.1 hypothetical protein HYH03_012645 [Edaphochlamys debaryana]